MNCIFVVEDEFDIQELLGNYLAEASYQVLAASDGVEAINLFEKEKDRIDLVLLDVMLPKIDGFGVLEVIRQSSLVPVIMLTALDDEAYQIKGYDLQADEYVTKPFSMQILLRKIGAVLRRSGKISKEENTEDLLCYGNLRLDLAGYQAWEGQRSWSLPRRNLNFCGNFWKTRGVCLQETSFWMLCGARIISVRTEL